jgi:hypothetical protein
MAIPLYAQPISQLDSYRFPPPSAEDIGEMATPPVIQFENIPQSNLFIQNFIFDDIHTTPDSQPWNDSNGFSEDFQPTSDINLFE